MSVDKAKIEVIGGQMIYSKLTTKVERKIYAIGKAHCWLDMINRNMRPKKWNKPTTKGTRVTFTSINSEQDVESAFTELEQYLQEINAEHGTDLCLNRKERETNE
ncbi:hypothetical protein FLT15_16480 [Paenibacillus thiaminolyticus]|uniref:hypothetical protein n=1 Tax=Paenibacillus thiaminolyticus TaxID=49283 RepID=UPI0011629578|nr:hypothetical protein [Paenibacillus thiaminolyticus]NGP58795.1 hypothetical protein [Paenibacillus thiaminolyticus]NGP59902.1 hypothetical protein [Paenibacillus thiaminolyticus]